MNQDVSIIKCGLCNSTVRLQKNQICSVCGHYLNTSSNINKFEKHQVIGTVTNYSYNDQQIIINNSSKMKDFSDSYIFLCAQVINFLYRYLLPFMLVYKNRYYIKYFAIYLVFDFFFTIYKHSKLCHDFERASTVTFSLFWYGISAYVIPFSFVYAWKIYGLILSFVLGIILRKALDHSSIKQY